MITFGASKWPFVAELEESSPQVRLVSRVALLQDLKLDLRLEHLLLRVTCQLKTWLLNLKLDQGAKLLT